MGVTVCYGYDKSHFLFYINIKFQDKQNMFAKRTLNKKSSRLNIVWWSCLRRMKLGWQNNKLGWIWLFSIRLNQIVKFYFLKQIKTTQKLVIQIAKQNNLKQTETYNLTWFAPKRQIMINNVKYCQIKMFKINKIIWLRLEKWNQNE